MECDGSGLLLIILLAALYSDAPGPDSQEKVD